jgi:hypothetical protein
VEWVATFSGLRTNGGNFSECKILERNHCQEWLENAPEAFGEELPIIQKEFDGFEDTRGRRDSLVLDKDGNLVIIEKKLDDIRSLCGLAGAEVRRLLRESEQFLAPDIRGG